MQGSSALLKRGMVLYRLSHAKLFGLGYLRKPAKTLK
jgi:hypothetical protein